LKRKNPEHPARDIAHKNIPALELSSAPFFQTKNTPPGNMAKAENSPRNPTELPINKSVKALFILCNFNFTRGVASVTVAAEERRTDKVADMQLVQKKFCQYANTNTNN
jgi:hypothetical protein